MMQLQPQNLKSNYGVESLEKSEDSTTTFIRESFQKPIILSEHTNGGAYMISDMQEYENEWEDQLNYNLLYKTEDTPLYEYVLDAWKSLEMVSNIKVRKWEYNTHESTIDINRHIRKRKKGQGKKKKVNYKFTKDDRFGCLTLWIDITVPEIDPKTKAHIVKTKTIKKNMLIPIQSEDGYFYIKGKRYYLIYQLVEKSTYTNPSSITFKSLMPVVLKRKTITKIDCDGETRILPLFYVRLFRKEVPIMLLYAAMGLRVSLNDLFVADIIKFTSSIDDVDTERFLCFQISKRCFIKVERDLFEKYQYVQSVVGGLLEIATNRLTIENMYDVNIWYRKLGNNGKPEKGRETLKNFQRILDETTKKVLKMHPYHKFDAYALLRYGQMNFNELRVKDNLSLENKRIRCNETISSLFTKDLSEKLNHVISLGNRATIENYIDLLKIPDDIILQKMHSSGILRYDENINDMTFFSKLKWTNCLSRNIVRYWNNLFNCWNSLLCYNCR